MSFIGEAEAKRFIDEVRAKRQKLADVLSDEEYSGIRMMVEELYPDQAHFIYELLQNAEDAGATHARFELAAGRLVFEHDGRAFTEGDVWGITNIGKGGKRDQEDMIGRFGVGFKSVFAYTETPHIWSETYSFTICKLVLPHAIARRKPPAGTRFEFPFNSSKKPAEIAFLEIRAGLAELADTTLLFLTNLGSIEWQIDGDAPGTILRVQHSENHIEVRAETSGEVSVSSRFLLFSEPVEGLPNQKVSVAFAMQFLPNVVEFDPKSAISDQLKIVPVPAGRVSVYFPAEKETSGLRFDVHAPFVPELSRASVKETAANQPLFKQLARLAAATLPTIRDLGLLTGEFLGVLPNSQESLTPRYAPIRTDILEAMNTQPLTPTHARSYAPAKQLLQAKASLKELLSEEDLSSFVQRGDGPSGWAIGATQRNSNQDRFLAGLDIVDWDMDAFVELLEERAFAAESAGPDPLFMAWLGAKSVEWHQQMYSLLYKELGPGSGLSRLRWPQIVRLSDGTYSAGPACYFPADRVEHDEVLPRVDSRVYSSGSRTTEQEGARKLLEAIGVREVGKLELVQGIVRRRYTDKSEAPDDETYLEDLERFLALLDDTQATRAVFEGAFIFKRASGDWGTPEQVFLDAPYRDTGLRAYYDAIGESSQKAALSDWYERASVSLDSMRKFAEAVGVQTQLRVAEVSCRGNADFGHLYSVPGSRCSSPIDSDFKILSLDELLISPSVELSMLVWRTMCSLSDAYLRARYQRNRSSGSRCAPSQLVHLLRKAAWVPQKDGSFVRPSAASRALLPPGFPFDEGDEWLKEVCFGADEQLQSEEHRTEQATARRMGFLDEESLQDAKWFAGLDPDERRRYREEIESRQQCGLPEHDSPNPARRAEKVRQEAESAPERTTETRPRSVPVGRDAVTQEAEQYLRQLYTNAEGEMICQVCRAPLPFRLDDGSFYVEKIVFLPDLRRLHYQNYLALCPNHAAMFQHANGSRELMMEMFLEMEGSELDVVLGQRDTKIYFTETHMKDLKAVIRSETAGDEGETDSSSGD